MKKLVQFNELVFNNDVYLKEQPPLITDIKTSKFELANGHGDYSPERCSGRKINSRTFDLSFIVDKNKFPCDYRDMIEQFIMSNLFKKGRLWAVEGDLLLWGIAKVTSISEGLEEKLHKLSYTATIYMEEGIWHIADPTTTFLQDYEICEIEECFEFLERPLCECCLCNYPELPVRKCPKCDGERLCDIKKSKLKEEIGNCGNKKKINYSCQTLEPLAKGFSEYNETTSYIEFTSNTLLDTNDVTLKICGEFTDLTIDWNGQKIMIKGTYKGETIISCGLVKNECKYLPLDKIKKVCSYSNCSNDDECKSPSFALELDNSTTLNEFTMKKGTNRVFLFGFKFDDIQEICIFGGGITI